MDMTEKTLSAERKYHGRILDLYVDAVELPGGRPGQREYVKHPGGVCVAPLTEDGALLFVRQFRYPYGRVLLELPAGKLTPGEDPLACGRRELKEETGATAAEYISLGTLYPSPGYTNEVIHLYAARGLTMGDACPDEDEFLEPEKIPLEEAVRMVLEGEIADAKTIALVLKIRLKRERGEM